MVKVRNKVGNRVVDALPDTPDFRDKLYEATLVEVPPRRELEEYRRAGVPILDQGTEGACTGFGLATVANYLLRTRKVGSDEQKVSPRMFYEMARRYDEWPGEDYQGSSARGAMKGWHKHGVCAETQWPYKPSDDLGGLTRERSADASQRPLGAYYRVNHKDLVCMHAAISEVGILYATAMVHRGWEKVGPDGKVERSDEVLGGHAFAIVAYDDKGFWVQNSWGKKWGFRGFCHVSYDDWLANGTDVWVARMGAPVRLGTPAAVARANSRAAAEGRSYAFQDLRPHIISLGNDGELENSGTYATNENSLKEIFQQDLPAITRGWSRKRVLLYAHGGLTDEESAVQHLADHRAELLEREIYPISFIWHSDFWSTLKNILADAISQRRPEGFLEDAGDFMLDRLDDVLEPVARSIGGKAEWDEMKKNATLATESPEGGARKALAHLKEFVQANKEKGKRKKDKREDKQEIEIHLVGHSAGSIFHAPIVPFLTGSDAGPKVEIASCTLWAPACTLELFKQAYLPAINNGRIDRFTLFTLTDRAEQDDHCAHLYHKSLLYLVSNAFEKIGRIPLLRDGVPILGMEKFIQDDAEVKQLLMTRALWVHAPNNEPLGSPDASASTSHGGFDDDQATLRATLARILAPTDKASRIAANLIDQRPLGIPTAGDQISRATSRLSKRRTGKPHPGRKKPKRKPAA